MKKEWFKNNGRGITRRILVMSAIIGLIFSAFQGIALFGEGAGRAPFFISVAVGTIVYTALVALLYYYLVYSRSSGKLFSHFGEILPELTDKRIALILFLLWTIPCLIRYPCSIGGGSNYQLMQFIGMDTLARQMSTVQYPGSFITAHHPVLLTLFFGAVYKFGIWISLGNKDFGLFLLSFVTVLVNCVGFTWILKTMRKYISNTCCWLLLLYLGLHPLLSSWASVILKDNLLSTGLCVWMVSSLVLCEEKKGNLVFLFMGVLIPFLKNQGIYIVIFSIVIMIFCFEKTCRKFLAVALLTTTLTYAVITSVIFPLAKIAPGGKQEMLSIPFQQTVNYMIKYPDDVTVEERNIIDSILPVQTITDSYNPRLADPVKFQYKQTASNSELLDYVVSVWIPQFLKHPDAYIIAFVQQTDAYYSDKYQVGDYIYPTTNDPILTGEKPVCAMLQKLSIHYSEYIIALGKLPILEGTYSIMNLWLLLLLIFGYGVICSSKRIYLPCVPLILQWLVCLLSPVNGSARYAMPLYYGVPILMLYALSLRKKEYGCFAKHLDDIACDTPA